MATARKEAEEKRLRALQPHPLPRPTPSPGPSTATEPARPASPSVTPLSSRAQSLRRFQISRSNSPSLGSPRSMGGGIQKRRPDGAAPGVAVLVEQLRRQPHSRQSSMVAGLVDKARVEGAIAGEPDEEPVKPRKRPVVNQAEKKWRAERQGAIAAAKQHLSEVLENSAQQAHQTTWEEESERLVKDLEQVALDLEHELEHEHDMEVDDHMDVTQAPTHKAQPPFMPTPISPPKPMKYQPRPPKQPRDVHRKLVPETEMEGVVAAGAGAGTTSAVVEDNEDDYVYDVYIRRPLSESEMLTNPLAELEREQQLQQLEAASRGIGVIVITPEDEEYWEHFVENEEEEWDSEDADSNGECKPYQNPNLIPWGCGLLLTCCLRQRRIILRMSIRMRNSRFRMKMMIRLLYIGNIGVVLRLMMRSLILMTPVVRAVRGMDPGMGFRIGILGIGIRMRRAIEWRDVWCICLLVRVGAMLLSACCLGLCVDCLAYVGVPVFWSHRCIPYIT